MLQPEFIHKLSASRRRAIILRSMEDVSSVYQEMRDIVQDIGRNGDAVALKHYRKYKADIQPEDLKVSAKEIQQAYKALDPKIVEALKVAAANIERFHRAQLEREMWTVEVQPGILAGRMVRPLEVVGAYVPGGKAAYPSSVLMNIIPAKVAGVKRIIACTPPSAGLAVSESTIVAADIAGAEALFRLGGPWAVGSMAYGTELVPKVDKIVGPGNKYVTAAKMAVFGMVDIDSPAGPSEGLILADDSPDPELVVLDFLSQVEHDPDAAAVLVTTSEKLAHEVCRRLAEKLEAIPRREIVEQAIKANSAVLIARSMEEAIEFTNDYAAEHLEILTSDPWLILPRIKHAGSIFMGIYAPIPVGDYASGTNHVLPTGRCARMFSGLSVDDFIKKPTFQYLSKEGLEALKETVITLAENEGLPLHAETIKARFRI
jgi:histidinol dehydrogenase